MKYKYIIIFLSLISLYSCKKIQKSTPIVQQINQNWQFKATDATDWKTASVPGNVFSDLLTHKDIPDPFIKTNEAKVQWVSDKNWEYKTTFKLSKEILKKNHLIIQFKGLDTYASIVLNGKTIANTTNAFRNYAFDIKKFAKKTNTLRITFQHVQSNEQLAAKKNPYTLPDGTRMYTRKAAFQYGWDWGPTLNTSGIWKPVSIKAWNDIRLQSVFVKQEKLTKEKAELSAQLSIQSDVDKRATLFTQIDKQEISTAINIKKGTHSYSIPLEIKEPTFWWTHNLGTPYLYQFDFQLIIDGKIKDEKQLKKGLRTIELITKKDSIGKAFYFQLNGVPIYIKGANYIPQNSFQNQVSDNDYKKLLLDVANSNMNMLRVWGGGIYENDVFYDLCDEKGILVWQDFMFANAMYPGDAEFLANTEQEAEEQVKRLRNHTSIALWCGNNEISEAWHRWGWQDGRGEKEKQEIWGNYQILFDTILKNTVNKFSDNTSYWESSPKYGRGNPKYQFEGDAHDWWVWHDAKPFEHFQKSVPRFMSEFGFQSFPSYAVINYMNQSDTLNIKTGAVKAHQKHARGFQLIRDYMARDYTIPNNDSDYVYVSQLLQARGIVMGIEAQRRAKPRNMGTLFWQLNDCWPAISWSGIDFFGNWKALQYQAKKAYKNLLISTTLNKDKVSTYLVNDSLDSKAGTLNLQLINFKGKSLWQRQINTVIDANTSRKVFEFTLDSLHIDKTSTVLISQFEGETSYFYFEKPKFLNLPTGEIKKEISKTKAGFRIRLQSTVLQKNIFLISQQQGHFSDNFFDLMPNKVVEIEFKTNAKALDNLVVKPLGLVR